MKKAKGSTPKKVIELGNTVRDIVTGFQGIATADVRYLNGCRQLCVKPKAEDGKMPEAHYIDMHQLQYVDDGVFVIASDTGGDMPDIPPTF